MTVAELIGKLRTKRQAATKTAFSHYISLVRELASGGETDADEVAVVLTATGKDEASLEKDVRLQEQRYSWAATMEANQQAHADRLQAERDLREAQAKLQEAYDRLMPAIDIAQTKLNDANHRQLITQGIESQLTDPANILDIELSQRETAVAKELRAIFQELKPLEIDRTRKQTLLENLESRLAELQESAAGPWMAHVVAPWLGRVNADIRMIESRIADVRSEWRQLDAAIRQRQATQVRLQAELAEIHRQKLLP